MHVCAKSVAVISSWCVFCSCVAVMCLVCGHGRLVLWVVSFYVECALVCGVCEWECFCVVSVEWWCCWCVICRFWCCVLCSVGMFLLWVWGLPERGV